MRFSSTHSNLNICLICARGALFSANKMCSYNTEYSVLYESSQSSTKYIFFLISLNYLEEELNIEQVGDDTKMLVRM